LPVASIMFKTRGMLLTRGLEQIVPATKCVWEQIATI